MLCVAFSISGIVLKKSFRSSHLFCFNLDIAAEDKVGSQEDCILACDDENV